MTNKTSIQNPVVQQKMDLPEPAPMFCDREATKASNVLSFIEHRKKAEAEEINSLYRKILSLVSHLKK